MGLTGHGDLNYISSVSTATEEIRAEICKQASIVCKHSLQMRYVFPAVVGYFLK